MGPEPRRPVIRRVLGRSARLQFFRVTDDELTDAWEAGTVFPGGVSHLQHLGIAWIVHRRHSPVEARARLLRGTERACEARGCPEKFDPVLTAQWAEAIADAINRGGIQASADRFLTADPEPQRGNLFGRPGYPQP
jgi:hypothetical protein